MSKALQIGSSISDETSFIPRSSSERYPRDINAVAETSLRVLFWEILSAFKFSPITSLSSTYQHPVSVISSMIALSSSVGRLEIVLNVSKSIFSSKSSSNNSCVPTEIMCVTTSTDPVSRSLG